MSALAGKNQTYPSGNSLESPLSKLKDQTTRIFLVSFFAAAFLYLPSLPWSFGHDQNVFAEIGHLILHGKSPYVDAWDVKPPNIFYTYALAEGLFGKSEFSIRLIDYLFALATFSLSFWVVKIRLPRYATFLTNGWENIAAALACLITSTTVLVLGLADTAQAESFSLPFLLGAFLLSSRPTPTRLFLAGLCVAIAGFYKTTNYIFVAPLLFDAVFLQKQIVSTKAQNTLLKSGIVITGVIVGTTLEVLVLYMQGAFSAYLHILQSVTQHHSDETQSSYVTLWQSFRVLWIYVGSWLLPAVIGIVLLLRKLENKGNRIILTNSILFYLSVLISGAIAVFVQRKGWGYHWVVLIPGLVLLVATTATITIQECHRAVNKRYAVHWLLILSTFVIICTGLSPTFERRYRLVRDSFLALQNRTKYLETLGERNAIYDPICTKTFAQYVERTTATSDKIFIFGHEPGVYWQSGREPSSRYIYTLLFTSPVMTEANFSELATSLWQDKPTLIAIDQRDTLGFSGKDYTSWQLLHTPRLTSVLSLLEQHYTLTDTLCTKFLIYRKTH